MKIGNSFSNPLKCLMGIMILMSCFTLLIACGDTGESSAGSEPDSSAIPLSLDLDLPDSITGGSLPANGDQPLFRAVGAGTGGACAFMGADGDDPFRNGYEMTKFMVSAVATWTCFTDTLIELAETVVHDDRIHATDNDIRRPDYDPDDPTHYWISDDSATQTTIRFYYGYDREVPPQREDAPQFFLSWLRSNADGLQGRLVIDGTGVNAAARNPDDPIWMRMDFNYGTTDKFVDTFMRFDAGNPWADGFRLQLTKDLSAGPLEQVFTALGLIAMKAQFLTAQGIEEVPDVHMFTVSDDFGNGAALAEYRQLALPLELNAGTDNHLGNYLFDKRDIYFFEADMDWDWVSKSIHTAVYRGGRTTPADGGTWIPFDPSLDMIAAELDLGFDYFTGELCAETDDDCLALLTAVFSDGFAGQEPNQGSDPLDWRSDALANATSLESVYPNGIDWEGAFEMVFAPTDP
ncbi:MAG: hypothetical protein QNJ22_01505 [Desulfosarcinaceae bacterium]|nr:hypothetical protein [Desulfosarcinaceae bacterium]